MVSSTADSLVFVWMELLRTWDGRVIPVTAKVCTSLEGICECIDVL